MSLSHTFKKSLHNYPWSSPDTNIHDHMAIFLNFLHKHLLLMSEYDQFVFRRHEFDRKTNELGLAVIDMSEVEMYKARDRGVSDATDIGLRSFLDHWSSSKLHQSTHSGPHLFWSRIYIKFDSTAFYLQRSGIISLTYYIQMSKKSSLFSKSTYLILVRNFLIII